MVKNLIAGFFDFKKNFFGTTNTFYENFVKYGQKPKFLVISCSDSRVDPAILFKTGPGDLFVVRNVANLVPPYQPDDRHHGISAAIEFGVRDLGIREIIVLGHAFCGGIKALCTHVQTGNVGDREFIGPWMKIAMPVMKQFSKNHKGYDIHKIEKAVVVNSMDNLRTFPWLKTLEDSQQLKIHGWWFEMENGTLWNYDQSKKVFRLIKENQK